MPSLPVNDAPCRVIDDVDFGADVVVGPFTNLYGCRIGDQTRIGPFVEIQRDVVIGARCKIQSHSFICTGVELKTRSSSATGRCSSTTSSPLRRRRRAR